MQRKIKILGVRTPAALKAGYSNLIGQVAELEGNAHHGFKIVLSDNTKIDLVHFYYTTKEDR
tara:strand:- start:706 stop:891 length:186 start_codon:yes stop_codon:yes gene_type:complete